MTAGSEHEASYDGVLVSSEVSAEELQLSLNGELGRRLEFFPQVRRALASWAEDAQGGSGRRNRTLFAREKYVTPSKVMSQMAMAYDALDDDIVGGVADTSEAMAFQKVTFESDDEDQEDIWSQIGRDLDLDSFVRVAWRELFTVSQFYGVKWWGAKTYKVRGVREERQSRKSFDLIVPTALGFLDPTRVVPVNCDPFGNCDLAWIASRYDVEVLEATRESEPSEETDPLIRSLFVEQYRPTEKEERDLNSEEIPTDNLILLNRNYVFRHALTKSPYERWARLRMKSVFPLLDLKHQQREMDRAWLLGGINFIVLVTRGTDLKPSNPAEVNATADMVRLQSRQPIIVTDHRIDIKIITPDIQHVLDPDKWEVIDERLLMRLWGTFQLASEGSNRETSLTLARIIARGLTSRRHMLKRTIEKEIIRPVIEQPVNRDFNADTSLDFSPKRMELEFDAVVAQILQELRDRGDLSRETLLNEFNFDQGLEARRRKIEAKEFDKVFKPVQVPFDSPAKITPSASGRKGGRPAGQPAKEEENDGSAN